MYRKKETEFQYAPGIESILEDVTGGGTIARADVKAVVDELPPLVVVGKDANGLYHVVKTAKMQAAAGATATDYPVLKGHLFVVGDVVTPSGLAKVAATIIAIDKTNADKDTITVDATLTAAAKDSILVLANAAAAAGSAAYKYTPEAITMNKVNTTVANQQSGLLANGTVIESVMPYPIDATIKAKLNIRFV